MAVTLNGITGSAGAAAGKVGRVINPSRLDWIRTTLTRILREMNDPAVRNLGTVLENNDYHKTTVLEHTLGAAEAFRGLMELAFIAEPKARERLADHLEVIVDLTSENKYNRIELTYLAVFLHDIGKGMINPKDSQPIVRDKVDRKTGEVELDESGKRKTTAPYHDSVGAPKAAEIARRELACSAAEAAFIETIVANHMAGFFLESSIADHETKIQQAASDKERTRLQAAKDNLTPDFLKKTGYNPLTMLHTMADLMGSEGHTSPTEQGFYPRLISSLFKLPRYSRVEDLENLAKAGNAILVPGRQLIEPAIRAIITADITARVEDGKVAADKAEGIINGRVQKVMAAVKYVPDLTSADQVEEAFYLNPASKLGQVVIFEEVK